MSEIQILIPLSYLAGAEELSAEGIQKKLESVATVRQEVEKSNTAVQSMKNQMKNWSDTLNNILDVDDPYEKAQHLRRFQMETKQFLVILESEIPNA